MWCISGLYPFIPLSNSNWIMIKTEAICFSPSPSSVNTTLLYLQTISLSFTETVCWNHPQPWLPLQLWSFNKVTHRYCMLGCIHWNQTHKFHLPISHWRCSQDTTYAFLSKLGYCSSLLAGYPVVKTLQQIQNSAEWTHVGGLGGILFRGCTSGGVYVPCIYMHAMWELP